jgi:hypothetical protein
MHIDPAARTKGDSADSTSKRESVPTDGQLQPIRLTLYTRSRFSPLKISSQNSGVTGRLIYLMTPQPVIELGLRREVPARRKPDELNRITQGNPRIATAV